MNGVDVVKQIQHMVRFVSQEAKEKANEFLVSVEEDDTFVDLNFVETHQLFRCRRRSRRHLRQCSRMTKEGDSIALLCGEINQENAFFVSTMRREALRCTS